MANDMCIVRQNLTQCQVCSRLSPEKTAEELNVINPSGTELGWRLSIEEQYAPVACDKYPDTHKHYIFEC